MRARQRERIRFAGANEEIFRDAIFRANLTSSIDAHKGYGPSVFTRTSAAWAFDHLNRLIRIPNGAARFTGARMVSNLASWDIFSSNWTKATDVTISKIGGISDGYRAMYGATDQSYVTKRQFSTYEPSAVYSVKINLKYVFGQWWRIMVYDGSLNQARAWVDLQNGVLGQTSTGGTASFVVSPQLVSVGDGWYQLSMSAKVNSSLATNYFQIGYQSADGSTSYVGAATKGIDIRYPHWEDVSGMSDKSILEPISYGKSPINSLVYSDDASQSSWTKTNVTPTYNIIANPLDARITATKIQATASAVASFYQTVTGQVSENGSHFVVFVKKGSGATDANTFKLRNSTTSTDILNIELNYDTGAITYVAGADGCIATDVGGGWWKLSMVSSSGFTNGDSLQVYIGFTSQAETAGEYCYYHAPQCGDGTTLPAFYTPVGAANDPHGSGADGVKYFAYAKDGSVISDSVMKGILIEPTRTNNLLYSRDLSNAVWSKINCTATRTVVGRDEIDNSASTLTASSDNATCLQTITLSAASRSFSASVKRRTGTGTINITRDGGTSWTDITGLINENSWTTVYITGTSVLNPTCGFQIITSGDAIDVDLCQDESGTSISSPIVTTGSAITRNQDSISWTNIGHVIDSYGTALVTSQLPEASGPTDSYPGFMFSTSLTSSPAYRGHTNNRLVSHDGTNQISAGTGTWARDASRHKIVGAWGAGPIRKLCKDGGSIYSIADYDSSWNSDIVYVGKSSTATTSTHVRDAVLWNRTLTDDEIKAVTIL